MFSTKHRGRTIGLLTIVSSLLSASNLQTSIRSAFTDATQRVTNVSHSCSGDILGSAEQRNSVSFSNVRTLSSVPAIHQATGANL